MVVNRSCTIELDLPTSCETEHLGCLLGQSLPAGSIVLLQGDLGTGKTTLVQAIGRGLNVLDEIVSPTFVLVNEYHTGRIPLYHFDLYRLQASQIKDLMIEQYWNEAEYEPGIIAIEWANRWGDRPEDALSIHLRMSSCAQERDAWDASEMNASADDTLNPVGESRTATLTLEGQFSRAMEEAWNRLLKLRVG